MATHDYVIANQGFPAFRSDLNDALAAIVSNNSSATEPTTMFAHMIWVDTAANPSILKIRNADNDAWITIGSIDQTGDTFTLVNLRTSGPVVFNDAGADVDFRVEGDTNANLLFVDAGNDRVGIGTSSPTRELDVSKAGTVYIRASDTTNSVNVDILAASSGGWIGTQSNHSFLFQTNNAERARITSGGYLKASNNGTYRSSIGAYHEFNQTDDSANLVINSTNASLTNEMLFLGATRNTTNNTFYAIRYYNDGAGAYKFQVADSGNVTNTNNSYGPISDIKFKKDIVDAASQWDDIKNIRIRKFRLKDDPEQVLQIGVIAQEVEEVSPGLVEDHRETKQVTKTREVEKTRVVTEAVLDEDGNEIEPAVTETYIDTEEYQEFEDTGETYKTFKATVLYMKAVKALQEAMERIETLEAKVAALENA